MFFVFQAGPTDIGSLGSKAKSGKKYDFWFRNRIVRHASQTITIDEFICADRKVVADSGLK